MAGHPRMDRMNKYDHAAVIVSPFCDNDCVFCRNRARLSADELQALEALIQRNVEHHLAHGATDVEISGGDPGEYDRLPELVRSLKEKGIRTVRLSTNGFRCADAAWAGALADAGLDSVKIPLYGPNAGIHEQVARKPGSFDAAVKALANFRGRKVGIVVNSLIVRQNRESLIDLHRLMLTFTEWRHCSFSIPCLSGSDTSFYVPIKDLRQDVLPLVYHGAMHDCPALFSELPLCVFGFEYPFLGRGGPPHQGLQQPQGRHRSTVPDVPAYRLKRKIAMCTRCRLADECDGFFANDVDRYGPGDLQPFQ